MATQKDFKVKNGLVTGGSITVGSTEIIDDSGNILGTALGSIDTDDVSEGSTNLYYTDSRVGTYLSTSGNVGIGTSSPTEALDVKKVSDSQQITFGRTTSSAGNGIIGADVSQALGVWSGAGSKLFTITQSGDVGIGTSSPGASLHIEDSTSPELRLSQSGSNKVRLRTDGDNYINTGQQLGVGTSSPETALHVNSGTSNNVATFESTDNYSLIKFKDSSTTTETSLGAYSNDMVFRAGSAEHMRIDSTGNVGIGTSSPERPLHIASSTPYIVFEETDIPQKFSIGSGGGKFFLYDETDAAQRLTVDSTGNVLVGKTAASKDTVGAELKPDGRINATMSSGNPLLLNRKTSDGDIAVFQKDNTTVGSIGVTNGKLIINSSGTNLVFSVGETIEANMDGTQFYPETDAGQNLGISNRRWKDLYLSGTANVGGLNSGGNIIADGDGNSRAIGFDFYGALKYNLYTDGVTDADKMHIRKGTTNVATFDTSGNVGIGTTSPDRPLEITDATGDGTGGVKISSYLPTLEMDDISAGGTSFILQHDGTSTLFKHNTTERMRIDSSGRLLVGTTDSVIFNESSSSNGVVIDGTNGAVQLKRNNDPALLINRTGSDGTLVNLYKDGTTVGSIGSYNNYLQVASQNGVLNLGSVSATTYYQMIDSTGSANPRIQASTDAAANLGTSGNRFKDLYLSGGVYLGGTGSANKLDDYEEGTWTPSFNGYTLGMSGSYVKIGNTVHCYIKRWAAITAGSITGNVQITGFPFSAQQTQVNSLAHIRGASTGASNRPWGFLLGTTMGLMLDSDFGSTSRYSPSHASWDGSKIIQNGSTSIIIDWLITYETS